ncbi:MAG TPA: glycine zipper family protein [Stellaceae bacterium]|nr:glycine zipper family protein [Stellaceae bacterium]
MRPVKKVAALAGMLALGACAVAPPPGPSVMALPAQGKDFATFQQDDATCRQYASAQTGGTTPGQAANNSEATSAALGTVLGAAAGAAIGAAAGNPAAGAAIGAGSGLFLGGATGLGAAGYSAAAVQQQYDMSYIQCMSAKGESVPSALNAPPGAYGYPYYGGYPYPYAYPYYGYYGYPAYAYGYPYGYYPGFVGVGFFGHGRFRR